VGADGAHVSLTQKVAHQLWHEHVDLAYGTLHRLEMEMVTVRRNDSFECIIVKVDELKMRQVGEKVRQEWFH